MQPYLPSAPLVCLLGASAALAPGPVDAGALRCEITVGQDADAAVAAALCELVKSRLTDAPTDAQTLAIRMPSPTQIEGQFADDPVAEPLRLEAVDTVLSERMLDRFADLLATRFGRLQQDLDQKD